LSPGDLAFRLSIIDSGGKLIPARLHAAGCQSVFIGKLLSFDDGIPFARTLKAVIVFATSKIIIGAALNANNKLPTNPSSVS
jgi:hypothetical protein